MDSKLDLTLVTVVYVFKDYIYSQTVMDLLSQLMGEDMASSLLMIILQWVAKHFMKLLITATLLRLKIPL